jgi:hypothetical protein
VGYCRASRAIAAGVLAMASGLLMWRIVGYTAANLGTGVSFEPAL